MRRLLAAIVLCVVGVGLAVAVAAPASAATPASTLVGFGSGKCLDVLGNHNAVGAHLEIYHCNGQSNQSWITTAAGELRTFGGTKCLDVSRQSTAPGARIILYTCNGGANQKWTVDADGSIVGVQSHLCLDVAGHRTADKSVVAMYTCNQQPNQQWRVGSAFCGSSPCGVRQVATDTDIPWGLVTLADGTIYYARRNSGDIVHLNPTTGAKTDLGTVPNVQTTGAEGGLLGLALSPSFGTDHLLYIMHTSPTDNRIVRMQVVGDKLVTSTEQVLVSGITRNTNHDGGRLRFGPDGKLYATTGDALNGANAQNLSSLNGKILRLNPDGSVPSDNPFGTYVWSYGHRNPQGLAFDSQGRLWEQEFGNNDLDETNLITKGGNYGWPTCEGTSGDCAGHGFVAPKQTYPTAQGSCSGIAIVHNVAYVACQRGTRLYRQNISGDSLLNEQVFFNGTYGRLRTVEPAPGGLWLTTTNGDGADKVLHLALSGS